MFLYLEHLSECFKSKLSYPYMDLIMLGSSEEGEGKEERYISGNLNVFFNLLNLFNNYFVNLLCMDLWTLCLESVKGN